MSAPIELRTDVIYVATNTANGTMHLLLPENLKKVEVVRLELDYPDPYGPGGNDRAEFQLLRERMEQWDFAL